jgi:hypothetical protein
LWCAGAKSAGGEEPDDCQHEGGDPGHEAQPGPRGQHRPTPGQYRPLPGVITDRCQSSSGLQKVSTDLHKVSIDYRPSPVQN